MSTAETTADVVIIDCSYPCELPDKAIDKAVTDMLIATAARCDTGWGFNRRDISVEFSDLSDAQMDQLSAELLAAGCETADWSRRPTPEDHRLVNIGGDQFQVMTLEKLKAVVFAGKADKRMVCEADSAGVIQQITCPYCATGVKHPGETVH